jgi:hypothetical protein
MYNGIFQTSAEGHTLLLKCGKFFSGNLSNSKKVFTLQKKVVSLMVGDKTRNPFRSLFKD